MQQIIQESGTHKEQFICSCCVLPCEVTETVGDSKYPRTVPPACHRFPSRKPEWKKVA